MHTTGVSWIHSLHRRLPPRESLPGCIYPRRRRSRNRSRRECPTTRCQQQRVQRSRSLLAQVPHSSWYTLLVLLFSPVCQCKYLYAQHRHLNPYAIAVQAPQNGTPMPNAAASHAVPQKGIKNGTIVDSTQRNVSHELQIVMSASSLPTPVRTYSQAWSKDVGLVQVQSLQFLWQSLDISDSLDAGPDRASSCGPAAGNGSQRRGTCQIVYFI